MLITLLHTRRFFSRLLPVALLLTLIATGDKSAQSAEKPRVVRDVVFAERESGPLKCDIYMPPAEGTYPGVLVVHGGAWTEGNGDKTQLFFIANRLAMQGFTAIAISYRLAPTHKWPAQIEDCKSAVRWVRRNAETYDVDPNWIAGWGYSAGAHLVSMLGTTDSSAGLEGADSGESPPSTRLQAVVAGGTPCDLRLFPLEDDSLAYFLGGTRSALPKAYEQVSPASYLSADDPPIFLYHGDADELVPVDQAVTMGAELKRLGVDAEVMVLPKAKHVGAALDMKAMAAGVEFLKKHYAASTATAAAGAVAAPVAAAVPAATLEPAAAP